MGFPIFAAGSAVHDDFLFVRQAAEIGMGHWLGSYSNLTHAKGIGYSLFLLLNHATGLPLKFSEHALYLAASCLFALTIGQLYRCRIATFVTFVLLAFLPTVWVAGAGGRVVREGLYISQSLLLLTLGIRCWVLHDGQEALAAAAQLRKQWPSLMALGLLAGWFWITREEGIWLLPAMALMMLYWLWLQRKRLRDWKPLAGFLALPLLAATLVVACVSTANYAVYGVFRNNDFRSSDFQAGYGALTRIRHEHWQRYVPFPADARQRAYAMSAAARELQPFFEGAGGETWRHIGCEQTSTSPCPEILSGWFMWALRDAVAQAGYYSNARSAQAFYRRLAAEIDAGCHQHPGDCLPPRSTLVPPWHKGYAQDTALASIQVFKTLATLGNLPPYIQASDGEAKYLALFQLVTNGPLAPAVAAASTALELKSPRDTVRMALARWFTDWIGKLTTVGLPLAFAIWALWTLAAIWRMLALRHSPSQIWIVSTALAAAIATRVVLLGFLEATSIPSNNMLYLFPLAPISLAMISVMFLAAIRMLFSRN